ncbi:efflux RND transporter periplasmic adaptor subunit [Chryseosolibacter indicus]|uniref:Efflux RND transporter periplasmic adaptor subunit n=1 Tax=Chryseosolibacter indicus TaxID=2782351 RepID=A0ABS5VRI5_9BACT|nr:efflux RND transporter periplasmic adaptor subunit [Chryseosolibacter indicus]MBT1704042.1 efflux RND transporter periplasmic adaptor subunit [Chryseosolibacter indicus]
MKRRRPSSFPLLFLWSILFACNDNTGEGAKESQGNAPVKDYPVVTLEPRSVTLARSYPATIEGQQNIEIRPKIDGYIDRIFVDEGSAVKKGQKLFQIMAPQYEQEVRTAQANIKIAEADVRTAEMEVNRIKPLVEKEIISRYELESAEFNLESRRAALAQARAQLANARTNLAYTLITSPVDGVVGTIPYRLGSLVSSNTTQPLTTVSDIQRIYAYFSINEKQALESATNLKGKTLEERLATIPPVKLILSNGSEYSHPGKIQTVSGQINTATGSLRVRATFPNPENLVRSGSTGNVQIPVQIDSALLVPQKSTYELQGKRFVYVVESTGTVRSQEIDVMENDNGQFFVVEKGLQPGEKIVVEGVASLRDGATVAPKAIGADSLFQALVKS